MTIAYTMKHKSVLILASTYNHASVNISTFSPSRNRRYMRLTLTRPLSSICHLLFMHVLNFTTSAPIICRDHSLIFCLQHLYYILVAIFQRLPGGICCYITVTLIIIKCLRLSFFDALLNV